MDDGRHKLDDFELYQTAREFRKKVYVLIKQLPKEERYCLDPQMRRATVSVTNNIAEGHGRFHYLEQIKFCLNSRGSLEELIDDLNICQDESYLSGAEIEALKRHGWRVHQLLNGYIRWLRERKQGATLELREESPAYGLTEDQLDQLLADPGDPAALTLQRFNALTI